MSQSNRPTMSGKELRRIRQQLDLTTDAFAIELGYEGSMNGNRNTMKRFETGERAIPLPIAKLAWMLSQHGIPAAWPAELEAQIQAEGLAVPRPHSNKEAV